MYDGSAADRQADGGILVRATLVKKLKIPATEHHFTGDADLKRPAGDEPLAARAGAILDCDYRLQHQASRGTSDASAVATCAQY